MLPRRALPTAMSCMRLRRHLVLEIHTNRSWLAPRGSTSSGTSAETSSASCRPDGEFPNNTSMSGPVLAEHSHLSQGESHPSRSRSSLITTVFPGKPPPASPAVSIERHPSVKPLPEDSDEAKERYGELMGMEVDELLEYMSREHRRLNKVHVALAMKRLFYLYNLHTDNQAFIQQLHDHPGFQVLYALVALEAQHYEAEVAADMLQFLAILGLGSNHPAVKVYLQLMKYHVSDLHLDILIRLAYALLRMTETPQTRLLLRAIRVLVPLRRRHIVTLNSWQLVTLLEIYGPDLEPDVTDEVMTQLLESEDEIGPRLSVILLGALSKIEERNEFLVGVCIEAVLRKMKVFSVAQVSTVLCSCNQLEFYDLELFKQLGQKVITDASLSEKTEILDLFSNQSFFHRELLADFKTHLSQELSAQTEFVGRSLLNIVKILSESVTPSSLTLDDSGATQQNLLPKDICSSLTRYIEDGWTGYTLGEQADIVSALTVLDCCPRHLVLELINRDVPETDACETNSVVFQLALAASPLRCTLPTRFAPILMTPAANAQTMKRALELAMGDPSLVLHGPLLDTGLVMDHLILRTQDVALPVEEFVQKDGGCLAFHNLPDGARKVAVLNLPSNCFHRNTGQMKGPRLLQARLLQRQGYYVVVIDSARWWRVEERDRVAHLRRTIENTFSQQDLWMM